VLYRGVVHICTQRVYHTLTSDLFERGAFGTPRELPTWLCRLPHKQWLDSKVSVAKVLRISLRIVKTRTQFEKTTRICGL
jgi:hypothetical protein